MSERVALSPKNRIIEGINEVVQSLSPRKKKVVTFAEVDEQQPSEESLRPVGESLNAIPGMFDNSLTPMKI